MGRKNSTVVDAEGPRARAPARRRAESNLLRVLVVLFGATLSHAGPIGCAGTDARDPGAELWLEIAEEDADADLYVDGQYVGTVGESRGTQAGSVRLRIGDHRVEIRKAGHYPVRRTVRVQRGHPDRLVYQAELLSEPP